MEDDVEVRNMVDVVFDITITGPYPDLDLCDIPGLNTGKKEIIDHCKTIIER